MQLLSLCRATYRIYGCRGLATIVFVIFSATTGPMGNVAAHSFDVALVVSLPENELTHASEIQRGFLLAASERDAHPGQVSDGHLGGLDVYVDVVAGNRRLGAGVQRLVLDNEVDIVAIFGERINAESIADTLVGEDFAVLVTDLSPLNDGDYGSSSSFTTNYKNRFGRPPSDFSFHGFRAAWRIDAAVRAQGGVENRAALNQSFTESQRRLEP